LIMKSNPQILLPNPSEQGKLQTFVIEF